jgi:hypothetical protein
LRWLLARGCGLLQNSTMASLIRAETLIEKLQYLPADKLAEVEELVDALRGKELSPASQTERSCSAGEAERVAPSVAGDRCSSVK